ncbi:hypothetical protein BCR43DRAFT_298309 [Syncephalastrum racemosum]|uniref:Uncharacterized protein n=1 Tax=Syncephalastrum racemosum TaxID=13706 RepID=A0A1X2H9J2_SYNRA|nr:hypothetical protein BCR43DRAFT_298309 [Syncephalastrum racemosum]
MVTLTADSGSSHTATSDRLRRYHPVIHHSLVLLFLLMVVLLPVLYIRTRQPPYWVLLVIFGTFIVIYIGYWIWMCLLPRPPPSAPSSPPSRLREMRENPSTVALPPGSDLSHSCQNSIERYPPPAYFSSFEHAVVDLPLNQRQSPPSYHSHKDEDDLPRPATAAAPR